MGYYVLLGKLVLRMLLRTLAGTTPPLLMTRTTLPPLQMLATFLLLAINATRLCIPDRVMVVLLAGGIALCRRCRDRPMHATELCHQQE